MSKICNRLYPKNSLLTVKVIGGVGCCPACEKPVDCHGKSVDLRALWWELSGDSGVSSETIVAHMMGNTEAMRYTSPPSDADDRGRCIRLLELIPEWIPRLHELTINEKPSEGLMVSSSGISAESNSWAEQIPLIIKEGRL